MSTEASNDIAEHSFAVHLDLLESGLNGKRDSSFNKLRRPALAAFNSLGFPGRKHEDWKYVSVRKLADRNLQPALPSSLSALPISLTGADEVHKLVFINGRWSEAHSTILKEADGITICGLAHGIDIMPALVESKFNSLSADQKEAFPALNTAFFQDGIFLDIPNGKHLQYPILVEEIHTDLGTDQLVFPRNLVIAGNDSSAKIYHTIAGVNSESNSKGAVRGNAMSEFFVGQNANVQWVELQDRNESGDFDYIHTIESEVLNGGTFSCYTLSLGGDLIRNDLRVRLNGPHAYTDLRGLYLPLESDVIDNHLRIDHAVPDCESNQLYKGIADGKGKGIFNGQIHVWKDAQRTNAYQTNKNVVLSDTASINTKPQLEIFADDVKCSHGATSGQLDKEAVFYLQARGIPKKEARSLLLNAFAANVLEGLADTEFRTYLDQRLQDKLMSH